MPLQTKSSAIALGPPAHFESSSGFQGRAFLSLSHELFRHFQEGLKLGRGFGAYQSKNDASTLCFWKKEHFCVTGGVLKTWPRRRREFCFLLLRVVLSVQWQQLRKPQPASMKTVNESMVEVNGWS